MTDRPTSDRPGGSHAAHVHDDLCLDLLLGYLSRTEEASVLAHLETCPACAGQLLARAAEAERLETTRVLRTLPDGRLVLDRREAEPGAGGGRRGHVGDVIRRLPDIARHLRSATPSRHRRSGMLAAGGLAAAVAALALVLWPTGWQPPDSTPLAPLPPYAFELGSRDRPSSAPDDDLRQGLEAYDRRDFARAAEALRRAGRAGETERLARIRKIYLGSALALTGDYEIAVAVLEDVPLALLPGAWGTESQWTFYVALRESGRAHRADSLLQVLATRPGEIGARARRLLEPPDRD